MKSFVLFESVEVKVTFRNLGQGRHNDLHLGHHSMGDPGQSFMVLIIKAGELS